MWIKCLRLILLLLAPPVIAGAQTLDVATIKPTPDDVRDEWFTTRGHHVVTVGTSLVELLKFVYGLHPSQIADAAPWMTKDRFDVDAVISTGRELNNDDMRAVLKELLEERFHLSVRMEAAKLPVFALTLVKDDSRLAKTTKRPGATVDIYGSNGELNVRNASMDDFAMGLSRGMLSRPVVNGTGLTGRYDFTLHWTPDGVNAPNPNAPPDMVSALPDEVGLRLKTTTADVPVLHIERAGQPSRD